MTNLTTYCSDCANNHTINCNNERKNSWYCPSYVKRLSEHEKHIMRIAYNMCGKLADCYYCPVYNICPAYLLNDDGVKYLFDWMMSLKENKDD